MNLKIFAAVAILALGAWWCRQNFQDAEPSPIAIPHPQEAVVPQQPEQRLQESAPASRPVVAKDVLDPLLNPLPEKNVARFSMVPSETSDTKSQKRIRWILDADRIALWKLEGKLTVYSREENLDLPPHEEEPDHLPQSFIADALGQQKRSISSESSR
ncbi:MAG: hypothetical protein K2X47_01945 [Bdellovibrionales bacterium]|nr:hypothetical protein [Bdellovibrionales bacterium]